MPMAAPAEIAVLDDSVKISGVLNFETVPALIKQYELLLKNSHTLSIDLGGVTDSNSAGLALLLEIVRTTKLHNKSINFKNLPAQISIVASAYGIDDELGSFLNSQFHS